MKNLFKLNQLILILSWIPVLYFLIYSGVFPVVLTVILVIMWGTNCVLTGWQLTHTVFWESAARLKFLIADYNKKIHKHMIAYDRIAKAANYVEKETSKSDMA